MFIRFSKMHPNFNRKHVNLTFFPIYEDKIFHEKLRITWFEPEFSQSRYNYNKNYTESNACTLIAILVASKCFLDKLQMYGPNKRVSHLLIHTLSMLEGNAIHESLKNKGRLSNINLTVPEGIKYSGMNKFGLTKWKSNVYMQPLEDSLYKNLKSEWIKWNRSKVGKKYQNLYVILISDLRSVLIIMNHKLDTVTLIDSHEHTRASGAVIATVNRPRMKRLCRWFEKTMNDCYQSCPKFYELSFLYFQEIKPKSK